MAARWSSSAEETGRTRKGRAAESISLGYASSDNLNMKMSLLAFGVRWRERHGAGFLGWHMI
jgi:hypothetical protein